MALITIKELSEKLKVSQSRIYKLTMDKALPYYKPFGGKVYFDEEEIDEFIRQHKILSSAEVKEQVTIKSLINGRVYNE